MIIETLSSIGTEASLFGDEPTTEAQYLKRVIPGYGHKLPPWADVVKAQALYETEQKWAEVRAKRNTLLAESDWTILPDTPLNDTTAWKTYRQALRDITHAATPDEVIWPVAP